MHYLITGATGLIGKAITFRLLQAEHNVTVLSRNYDKARRIFPEQVHIINQISELDTATSIDVVINLAGAPIADKPWTPKRKYTLEHSRIDFTHHLLTELKRLNIKPKALISGSAVGFYGDGGEMVLTEDSPAQDDYAHRLCERWEKAALTAQQEGIRVCIVRTGLVLAAEGGFLKRLLLPFKLGLGCRLGSGHHYMPWIHLNDIANLFIFLSEQNNLSGIYNGTAPTPVTNAVFTHTLASTLHRPQFLVAPASLLKLFLGEMSSLLLNGQNAIPQKAQAAGFKFEYTDLQSALNNLFKFKT